MNSLTGRTALVTGGSRGIGAAVVEALLAEGAHVVFTHLADGERAEKLVGRCGAPPDSLRCFDADVRDPVAVRRVVEETIARMGGLEILVNVAGINRDRVIWKMNDEEWNDVIATDLTGCFNMIRAVTPHFRLARRGTIVSISSINGLRGKFGQSNYAAAKAGIIGLSKSVARELAAYGVRVNVVCPGLIATDMVRSMPPEALERSRKEILLGRIGQPEDVASLVVFLAGDGARHVTGQVINVDGGQYL